MQEPLQTREDREQECRALEVEGRKGGEPGGAETPDRKQRVRDATPPPLTSLQLSPHPGSGTLSPLISRWRRAHVQALPHADVCWVNELRYNGTGLMRRRADMFGALKGRVGFGGGVTWLVPYCSRPPRCHSWTTTVNEFGTRARRRSELIVTKGPERDPVRAGA